MPSMIEVPSDRGTEERREQWKRESTLQGLQEKHETNKNKNYDMIVDRNQRSRTSGCASKPD